ncbi:hypothetical protein F2P81_004065 [Scophthalmus maximus]|uniref:Uncharacterized protein n=1 Tax=Scophthalmus maximus TaxID=52904 RepID=A0A6A4TE84_SCOMX|nr:hypothetical protein F2P81_004065 [Scophthalmus maximus]
MDRSGMLCGLLLLGLLSARCLGQASQEVSAAEDFAADKPEPAADRDLMEALEALLGTMHSRISSAEKRGSIPLVTAYKYDILILIYGVPYITPPPPDEFNHQLPAAN